MSNALQLVTELAALRLICAGSNCERLTVPAPANQHEPLHHDRRAHVDGDVDARACCSCLIYSIVKGTQNRAVIGVAVTGTRSHQLVEHSANSLKLSDSGFYHLQLL